MGGDRMPHDSRDIVDGIFGRVRRGHGSDDNSRLAAYGTARGNENVY
jgi:hypothetical protein